MRHVSPLNARRWRNFKANRRGLISLWLFGILFFVCFCGFGITGIKKRAKKEKVRCDFAQLLFPCLLLCLLSYI